MEDVVLDASWVLKWILREKEEGVAEARRLHDRIVTGEVRAMAPEILLAEVVNVMYRKKKFGRWEILEFIEMISDGRIGLVALDSFKFSELIEMMEQRRVTVYDAYYLVLAEKNGCKVMSFDRKIREVNLR